MTDAASFDYDISDGNGGTDSASVTVDVTCDNDAPSAADDTASGPRTRRPTSGQTCWPTTPTSTATHLSVSGVSNARGGSVDLTAGVVTFTPDADLCRPTGSFDYDISDGNGGSDSASVTVDITCDNDAPVPATTRSTGPRTWRPTSIRQTC